MGYDPLTESLRLLEGAPPANEARLSRRVRHLPLGVDRDEEVAATLFLRRGVSGVALLDVHALELSGRGWRLLGGGGGPGEEALGRRPRLADLRAPVRSDGIGATARARSGRLRPSEHNWVYWVTMRAAAEVATLFVADRRLSVAAHGMAVLVWRGEPPAVTALDASGAILGRIPLIATIFPTGVSSPSAVPGLDRN